MRSARARAGNSALTWGQPMARRVVMRACSMGRGMSCFGPVVARGVPRTTTPHLVLLRIRPQA